VGRSILAGHHCSCRAELAGITYCFHFISLLLICHNHDFVVKLRNADIMRRDADGLHYLLYFLFCRGWCHYDYHFCLLKPASKNPD